MRRGVGLASALLLGACMVGPNYQAPPSVASNAVARGTFVRAADPALSGAPGLARWWEPLDDPTLTALIDDALAHSPNIETAQGLIREAAAQLGRQRAAQLPTVSGSAAYIHANLPGVGIGATTEGNGAGGAAASDQTAAAGGFSSKLDYYNLGLTASWELDLFGGGRRSVEVARATVGRRFADLADAQVSLTTQVAQAYVNLRDAQARGRLNVQSVRLQLRELELAELRQQRGAISALDVERLRNQLAGTEAQNLPLTAQVEDYLNQLAVLTGRAPGTLDRTLSTEIPIPLPPAQVPIGDPASLIALRPDVRSAERALAAGTSQIGADKAKLFPRLQFLGILGLGGQHPGDVFDLGNLTTILAPQLSWAFLDFGKNQAAVRQSEAQRDQAEARYRQAVLSALQDAETSLSRFGNARSQLGKLVVAQQSASTAARLSALRAQAGTISVADDLDVERQRLSAAISVAQATAQLTNDYIAIQKALGLGWSPQAGNQKRDVN